MLLFLVLLVLLVLDKSCSGSLLLQDEKELANVHSGCWLGESEVFYFTAETKFAQAKQQCEELDASLIAFDDSSQITNFAIGLIKLVTYLEQQDSTKDVNLLSSEAEAIKVWADSEAPGSLCSL